MEVYSPRKWLIFINQKNREIKIVMTAELLSLVLLLRINS